MKRYETLLDTIRGYGKACVAFSGGVDSTLLAKAAWDALAENTLLVTAVSVFFTAAERNEAKAFAYGLGAAFEELPIDILSVPHVAENPKDRCYFCKQALFQAIQAHARAKGIGVVLEGSNVDDQADYRPGSRALRELGIKSPLLECGFTKAEIRALLQELGLPVYQKPSSACLASRIRCGEPITPAKLRRTEKAEAYLHSLGFSQLRVRSHGDLARLEFLPEELGRIFNENDVTKVESALKEFGFAYVCVDLGGYRPAGLAQR